MTILARARARRRVGRDQSVGENEAKELYLGYSVPGAGEPLFQAASASINPWSEARFDSMNPERGPMLTEQGSAFARAPQPKKAGASR